MAIGWLSVLQAVPWSEVIANAPKVADGAKKLWNTVSKKTVPTPAAPDSADTTSTASSSTPQAQAMAALASRVTALEATTAQMHEQLVASSALIQALAEQNAQLIQGLQVSRVRILWLAGVALLGAITGVLSLTVLQAS